MLRRSGSSPVWSIVRLTPSAPSWVSAVQIWTAAVLVSSSGLTLLAVLKKDISEAVYLDGAIQNRSDEVWSGNAGFFPFVIKWSGVYWLSCSNPTADGRHLTSNLRTAFWFSFSFPPRRYPQISSCHRSEEKFENMIWVAFAWFCSLSETKASTNAACSSPITDKVTEMCMWKDHVGFPWNLILLYFSLGTGAVRGIST